MATGERISNITVHAGTLGGVIKNVAFGTWTANARTWIFTFVIHTSKLTRTIAIRDTLWTTTAVWITNIIRQTFACACSISFVTNCVRATRIGRARMAIFIMSNCWKNLFIRDLLSVCYESGWKQKRLTA